MHNLPVFSLISQSTENKAGFILWQFKVCFLKQINEIYEFPHCTLEANSSQKLLKVLKFLFHSKLTSHSLHKPHISGFYRLIDRSLKKKKWTIAT